MKNNEK